MPSKLIFFTGAPEAESLNWDHDNLIDTFDRPIARFARFEGYEHNLISDTPASAPNYPFWRSIPLDRQHLPTGMSQDHAWREEFQGAQFFATSYIDSFMEELTQGPTGDTQVSSIVSSQQILSQFYEESYAVHRDVPSSQIQAVSQTETSFATDGSSSYDPTESFESIVRPLDQRKDIPTSGPLSSLDGIPNAAYLNSIHPQTMTVNLIVGIISNPEPRAIKTRRGAHVELVELLVGDETKSGFGINFWLNSSHGDQDDTRNVLAGLRPQDVVLIRNVALSSFRGKVYGQSLRKDMTKVFLFYRSRIDKSDVGGCYSASELATVDVRNAQVEKTQRVREWVSKFVGVGRPKGKRSAGEVFREVLPLDTQ